MLLRVQSITYLAARVNSYELVDCEARDLPPFEAGAHISVRVGDAPVRDFSLWNDPAERARYRIAVLREPDGRGSREWHDRVRAGDIVEASSPRNNFRLTAEAGRYLLIAGGIGITPLMAMVAVLRRRGAEFRLHYCTRSPEETPFFEDLAILAAQGRVVFHHDGGDPAKGLDIAATLREHLPGTHLYYCGPTGMMAAAASASRHWPPETVHCEYFAGPNAVPPMLPG
ncbi:MAG: ferredoxin reductase [Alphaproteobacteria bacterium]|nr:ferredoxin reductase [Alphaproteobacteria bacterium]